jgi:PAS domain-containing protein
LREGSTKSVDKQSVRLLRLRGLADMSDRLEMLEGTLDLMEEGVAILDEQSNILFWNKAASSLTGYLTDGAGRVRMAKQAGPAGRCALRWDIGGQSRGIRAECRCWRSVRRTMRSAMNCCILRLWYR